MLSIVLYNILAGGYNSRPSGTKRVDQLTRILHSTRADVMGLVEATNPRRTERPSVIEELAERLGMQLVMDEEAMHYQEYQPALLTRLPVIYTKVHTRPGVLSHPLLEVCVEETHGQRLIVFVTHLSAAFSRGRAGNAIRKREVRTILSITAPLRESGEPHLIMGDFNSLAPGAAFKASNLLRYLVHLDERRKQFQLGEGHPHLNFVVPRRLRFLNPLLRIIPRSELLAALFDAAASLYAPRGSIALLQRASYVDCYQHIHPREQGFTCPAAAPAGRIDFIFASPTMAKRLESCCIATECDGLAGQDASDHLAVAACFRSIY